MMKLSPAIMTEFLETAKISGKRIWSRVRVERGIAHASGGLYQRLHKLCSGPLNLVRRRGYRYVLTELGRILWNDGSPLIWRQGIMDPRTQQRLDSWMV